MNKTLLILAFALSISGHSSAASQKSDQVWQVLGAGQLQCGKWTIARQENEAVQVELFKQWVASWVVTYNYYETERGSKRYVDQPDFDTITAYIDKFCSDRPLSTLAFGAAQLVQDLGGAKALHNRKPPR